MNSTCPVLWPFWRHNLHWLPSYYPQFSMTSFKMTVCIKAWNNFFKILLFCIPIQLMHFDCVNGFLNSIKEIIWQTEAIYRCPLNWTSEGKWFTTTNCIVLKKIKCSDYLSQVITCTCFMSEQDNNGHFNFAPPNSSAWGTKKWAANPEWEGKK